MKTIKLLTMVAAAATLLFQSFIARADENGQDNQDHRNASVTWTKWITERFPNAGPTDVFGTLGGPAEGDIGDGTVTGEAFNPRTITGNFVSFEADYHFRGSKHSFTVHFFVTQSLLDNSGVVQGVITDGWLKGNRVVGHYTARDCHAGEGTVSKCFEGTAEIERGSKDNH